MLDDHMSMRIPIKVLGSLALPLAELLSFDFSSQTLYPVFFFKARPIPRHDQLPYSP
jgi:hypothetical protein